MKRVLGMIAKDTKEVVFTNLTGDPARIYVDGECLTRVLNDTNFRLNKDESEKLIGKRITSNRNILMRTR